MRSGRKVLSLLRHCWWIQPWVFCGSGYMCLLLGSHVWTRVAFQLSAFRITTTGECVFVPSLVYLCDDPYSNTISWLNFLCAYITISSQFFGWISVRQFPTAQLFSVGAIWRWAKHLVASQMAICSCLACINFTATRSKVNEESSLKKRKLPTLEFWFLEGTVGLTGAYLQREKEKITSVHELPLAVEKSTPTYITPESAFFTAESVTPVYVAVLSDGIPSWNAITDARGLR